MSSPVLHLVAGPNGSGKSTFIERALLATVHLDSVDADRIAAARWPGAESAHAYEASRLAAEARSALLRNGTSFIAETVFSHESKVELVEQAARLGYLVHLHVILVPVELAVARVSERVRRGGHAVPEAKVRDRFTRLWPLVARATRVADRVDLRDNSRADAPFRLVAIVERGRLIGTPDWPAWTPQVLRNLH